ncbi:MAG: sensor histidine kinase [Bradymonadia bacterium]
MTQPAPPHPEEVKRLVTLQKLRLLDSAAEEAFDRITRLAAYICEVPISLVSLVDVDRQWFKSRVGLDAEETHRDLAFCAHAILQDETFIVANALEDERFQQNPLVTEAPDIRFYAGVPLVHDEMPVGTLCVIDRVPRHLTDAQLQALQDLGAQVEYLLDLRAKTARAERHNADLVDFMGVLAHDLKSPVINIESLLEILCEDHGDAIPEMVPMLNMAHTRAGRLRRLMQDLFSYWRLEERDEAMVPVDLNRVAADVQGMIPDSEQVQWRIEPLPTVLGASVALHHVMQNLMSNAVKYNDKAQPEISVKAVTQAGFWRIEVSDNGPGIHPDHHDRVFEKLKTLQSRDKVESSGLGLAIVKRIIEERGGNVGVESDGAHGSTFWFTIPSALPAL